MTRFKRYEDFRDWVHPAPSPNRCYRYSVAFYRGKRRVVVAWFEYEREAMDYLARCRSTRPDLKYDYCKSLF